MLFWSVCRNYFAAKPKYSRSMDIKDWTVFLNWNSFFLKLFFWTRKMHFWQPRWKSFGRMKVSFYSLSEIHENKYFQVENFSICSIGQVQVVLRNLTERILTKEPSTHAEHARKRILIFYPRVKKFPQNKIFDTSNALFTTGRKRFDKQPKIFAEYPKMKWKICDVVSKISLKCSYRHVEWSFDMLALNFIQRDKLLWSLSKNVREKRLF